MSRRLGADARGALFMLASGTVFTLGFAALKSVADDLPPGVMVLFRHAFGALCFAPLFVGRGFGFFATRRLASHGWRTLVGLASFSTITVCLAYLPLGDVVALSFTAPLWSALLAIVWFAEPVRPLRVAATLVGFLGVLLIARPSSATFEPISLVALASGLFTALAMVMVKQLSRTESPDSAAFYFLAIGAVYTLPWALWNWRTPTLRQFAVLFGVGAASFVGQLWLNRAYKLGTFSKVAPMDFLRLPVSIAIGIVAFAEWPDLWSVLGMAVIGLASLAIVRSRAPAAKPEAAEEPR